MFMFVDSPEISFSLKYEQRTYMFYTDTVKCFEWGDIGHKWLGIARVGVEASEVAGATAGELVEQESSTGAPRLVMQSKERDLPLGPSRRSPPPRGNRLRPKVRFLLPVQQ